MNNDINSSDELPLGLYFRGTDRAIKKFGGDEITIADIYLLLETECLDNVDKKNTRTLLERLLKYGIKNNLLYRKGHKLKFRKIYKPTK